MKISLYLPNRDIAGVNLSNPEKGNPGIGGTEFNFITLPYYFNKYLPGKVEFFLLANSVSNLPKNLETIKASNQLEAVTKSKKLGCDIHIWRPKPPQGTKDFIQAVNATNLKIIAWAHNNPGFRSLNLLSQCSKIKRLVTVSQEQMDRLRDHRIIDKTTRIYNGFDPTPYIPKNIKKDNKDEKTVTYLGSLVPSKGFHHLARVWPDIKKRVTSAKLIVIGSGKLYNRDQSLGKWGIAEENYEKNYIRPYLSDSDGNIDNSVGFKGLMGREKIEIMKDTDVGVVNPSGKTENCPGSAIEFQATGVPVVSGAYRGLYDTVIHKKTGLLGRGNRQLVKNIVYLLENEETSKKFGQNGIEFVEERFNYNDISKEWLKLFDDVIENKPNTVGVVNQHPFNDYKILRELFRVSNKYIPGFQVIPSPREFRFHAKKIYHKIK